MEAKTPLLLPALPSAQDADNTLIKEKVEKP